MKIVTTYVADDGEEFYSEADCYAYEHRFDDANEAVIFLDDEFNIIPFRLDEVYEKFMYFVIRNEEKAFKLFRDIHEWEHCFEMPGEYHDGDLIAWDAGKYEYVDLRAQRDELNRKINAIKKAVSQLG